LLKGFVCGPRHLLDMNRQALEGCPKFCGNLGWASETS
jgi:hypothetical protein